MDSLDRRSWSRPVTLLMILKTACCGCGFAHPFWYRVLLLPLHQIPEPSFSDWDPDARRRLGDSGTWNALTPGHCQFCVSAVQCQPLEFRVTQGRDPIPLLQFHMRPSRIPAGPTAGGCLQGHSQGQQFDAFAWTSLDTARRPADSNVSRSLPVRPPDPNQQSVPVPAKRGFCCLFRSPALYPSAPPYPQRPGKFKSHVPKAAVSRIRPSTALFVSSSLLPLSRAGWMLTRSKSWRTVISWKGVGK